MENKEYKEITGELVKVNFEDNTYKLIFFSEETKTLCTVKWNLQAYDKNNNCFVDSPEKAAQVEEWSKEYFGVDLSDIEKAIGTKKTIYCYEKFNSLWISESKFVRFEKFTGKEKKSFQAVIKDVTVDNVGYHVSFEYEGKLYERKFATSEWIDTPTMRGFYESTEKKTKADEKFKEIFGVTIEDKETLIGKEILVQVKKAFSSYYADIALIG